MFKFSEKTLVLLNFSQVHSVSFLDACLWHLRKMNQEVFLLSFVSAKIMLFISLVIYSFFTSLSYTRTPVDYLISSQCSWL